MPSKIPFLASCGCVIRDGKPCQHLIAKEKARRQRADANRPNFRQRGYTSKWDTTRADFLKAHPVCCVEGCTQPATVVDHIIPHRDENGVSNPKLFWGRKNWQPLCRTHHSSWKQRAERKQRNG